MPRMADECRIDLVTGKTIHHVKASAFHIADALRGGERLVKIPTEPPIWLNPAHIVTIQDTDPDSVRSRSEIRPTLGASEE
jgi:hypothetical protein